MKGRPLILKNVCGLRATPPVKWLLDTEPLVREEVLKFVRGQRDSNEIDVAAPPSWQERLRHRINPKSPLELPIIKLDCSFVEHLGDNYVLVTASDEHLDLIVEMAIAAGESFKEQVTAAERYLATGKMSN